MNTPKDMKVRLNKYNLVEVEPHTIELIVKHFEKRVQEKLNERV